MLSDTAYGITKKCKTMGNILKVAFLNLEGNRLFQFQC